MKEDVFLSLNKIGTCIIFMQVPVFYYKSRDLEFKD